MFTEKLSLHYKLKLFENSYCHLRSIIKDETETRWISSVHVYSNKNMFAGILINVPQHW